MTWSTKYPFRRSKRSWPSGGRRIGRAAKNDGRELLRHIHPFGHVNLSQDFDDVENNRLATRLKKVHNMLKKQGTLLRAIGGNDDVVVELLVSRRTWSKILKGQELTLRRQGFAYEGDFYRDYWDFSGGLDGELRVRYGSPKDGDYSGEGFVGSPRDALVEE